MARRPARELLESLDRDALAQFQAGIRKRYSDEDIVKQLQESARRLGRSPSMREFAADEETTVHPQTVIEHFGSWNAAKRAAGLVPRRFATREELLQLLREMGERLERTPTARDLDEHRGSMPSKSLYWHTFGSLTTALREAGFDVPVGEERLERAIDQGCDVALKLGRLPKFQEWGAARREDQSLLTEWQIYRMFDVRRGAWSTFQYLIRERLLEDGYDVSPDGRVSKKTGVRATRARSATASRTRARPARARRGGAAR
jgi:Homing endonuclease associated repeat